MRRLGALVLTLGLVALPRPTSAGGGPAADDPFASAADADPLELGRRVQRHGDDAVLARLAEAQPAVVQLAAIRASRFMRAPEAALPRLARIARGRDPDLAPAAALACHRITRDLDASGLARREARRTELAPARADLEALAGDESARRDIRRVAAFAASALAAVDVPAK